MKKLTLLGGLLFIILAACNQTEAVPTVASTPTNIPVYSVLPHPLYFLSDISDGTFQIWRLSPDLKVLFQITNETKDVVDFDISPSDGGAAYITQNQIFLINTDGSGRTLLVDGGPVDEQSNAYHFAKKLNGVSWSPDGETLAYGLDGIHIYFLSEQSDLHVVQNIIIADAEGELTPTSLYSPISWSPDGSSILLEVGLIEGGSLAVYHLENDSLVRLGGDGIVCCHPAWSPESDSVLVASPIIGVLPAGLWRFNAETGVETELIHHTSDDGTLNFASWPLQLQNGELCYFFNNTPAFPEGEVSMVMVSAGGDAVSERTPIRIEYWQNYEVLWAEDGSLALAVQPATGVPPGWPRTGPILLIPANSEAVIPLAGNGYSLRWGP